MMAMLNNPKAAQREVDKWNAAYPVGQSVKVRKDNGDVVDTYTTSRAELLSGHSAVIWVNGISACYLLKRVTAVTGEGA